MVFQLAGRRGTLAPGGVPAAGTPQAPIVFIAEIGVPSTAKINMIVAECIETG